MVSIIKEEGIRGLWRGTLPGQLLTVPYTAVQFVALQQFKAAAARRGLLQGSQAPLLSFAGGAFAGAVATVASYPFDLLRTTLAAQGEPRVYRGMMDAAKGILAAHGVAGLYRGLSITLLEIVPYAALQFGVYDALTTAAVAARRQAAAARVAGEAPHNSSQERLDRFLCGLAAGMIAKLGTHPLDVAKKRFQVAGLQRSLGYGARIPADMRSLPACLARIWATEGLRGLYKGVLPSIIKAAPSAAVTLSAYEFFLGYLAAAAEKRSERA
ncbi:hypothetical protein WJX81_005301 [Elliptochloris bilobata]|uniref:Uncharacterized protein n=1 Tax=Elliptochloris bilobata TaxID=381761 RepID=A0AAW1SIJ9_9CHLO